MRQKIFIILFLIFALLVGIYIFFQYSFSQKVKNISSFDDCAKSFPILESFPEQCKTPDGRTFTKDLGNQDKYRDEIVIDFPRPQTSIVSPLAINGKAKGFWFFEGSFPVELTDESGNSLGKGVVTAQGDSQTTDFVAFKGEISFDKPSVTRGKLILRNDNPSGLPENQKEITIPVVFK